MSGLWLAYDNSRLAKYPRTERKLQISLFMEDDRNGDRPRNIFHKTIRATASPLGIQPSDHDAMETLATAA